MESNTYLSTLKTCSVAMEIGRLTDTRAHTHTLLGTKATEHFVLLNIGA